MPPTAVNLDALVAEIVSLREREIEQSQARIEVKSPLGAVTAHLPTVQQILANLIDNGLKFVSKDKQPHLSIWTEPAVMNGHDSKADNTPDGSALRIWVEDNGIGIEKEFHEKIFGLFERLHPSHAFPGTGLGLAIVRKGVERMGGRVGLESQPDNGSRFWVELPADTAQNKTSRQ
jgi:signal transduction histidine kinase